MSTDNQAVATTRHVVVDSPIGSLTVVRDDAGYTGLYFDGHWTRPDTGTFGPQVDAAVDHSFDDAITQLREYFDGARRTFDLPLSPHGDPLHMRVWELLSQIPYGQTTTYGAIAKKLGDGVTPREVGKHVGHNPLSILVGCHRVVGKTGMLTGYAGGFGRKRYLLELEGALPPTLDGPTISGA
jgi:methylated-DNA-[protein]-cysteine S-methyltransferase